MFLLFTLTMNTDYCSNNTAQQYRNFGDHSTLQKKLSHHQRDYTYLLDNQQQDNLVGGMSVKVTYLPQGSYRQPQDPKTAVQDQGWVKQYSTTCIATDEIRSHVAQCDLYNYKTLTHSHHPRFDTGLVHTSQIIAMAKQDTPCKSPI